LTEQGSQGRYEIKQLPSDKCQRPVTRHQAQNRQGHIALGNRL